MEQEEQPESDGAAQSATRCCDWSPRGNRVGNLNAG